MLEWRSEAGLLVEEAPGVPDLVGYDAELRKMSEEDVANDLCAVQNADSR